MEENNEVKTKENDIKISEMLKELKDSFLDLSKVRIAYGRSITKEKTNEAFNKCKDGIYNAAKKAKIDLENNTQKYEETKNEVDSILAEYNLSLETLKTSYNNISEENNLKLAELYGKKDELIAYSHELRESIKEHNAINNSKADNEIIPLEAEKSYYEQKAIEAIQSGDYNKSKEYLNKCDELKLKVYQTEEKYNQIKNPYEEKFKANFKEYMNCQKQIKEAEELAQELEKNFNENCNELSENKEQALAKVENNKMFDKIKGFLSKSVLSNINKTKKFKENTLVPTKNNVEKFAKSVPEKAKNLKEKSNSKFKSIFEKGKETIINAKDKVVEKAENVHDFANDKISDLKETGRQAKDFTFGKVSQFKEKTIEKVGDIRDFASDKVADVKEAGSQAKDFISGKAYQTVDAAYNLGVDTVAKGRESAINSLNKKIARMQQKAQELKNKNKALENKRNARNNEKGLF